MTGFAQRLRRVLDFFRPENLAKQTIRYEGDTALLVIDVQKEFCAEPDLLDRALFNMRRGNQETKDVSARIQSLVPEFRKAGIPVYAVYFDLGGKPHFYNFKPVRGDVVLSKNNDSAFDRTDLKEILAEHGRKNLLTCGFNLNACVYQTAMDAVKEGFNVSLLRDLCGNDAVNDYEPAYYVNEMRNSGVTIEEDAVGVLKKINERKMVA